MKREKKTKTKTNTSIRIHLHNCSCIYVYLVICLHTIVWRKNDGNATESASEAKERWYHSQRCE